MKKHFKKILILSYSDLSTDPRVVRQINALKDKYSITACGYNTSDIDGIRFISIYPKNVSVINFHHRYPKPIRKVFSLFIKNFSRFKKNQIRKKRLAAERSMNYEKRYWTYDKIEFMKNLNSEKFDLIIANDIETLPLALKISNDNSKVILDSHEYHPRQFEHSEKWKKSSQQYVEYLCSKYMKKADVTFAVSQGIADEFRINYKTDPELLTNAADFNELTPSKVNEKNIRLIHHGAAIKARKLELMIDMMEFTDSRFTLDLMLVPTDTEYFEDLKKDLTNNKKVRLIDPVKTKDIPERINEYDIGIFILPPVNFNYKHALPNKFFEFIQARLAIAIGPSIEMERLVKKYDLGIIASDFRPETMADCLNKLSTEDINNFKHNSDKQAFELSAEKNLELIRKQADDLLYNLKYAEQE
ncbi:MAG: hypothetical protein WAT71_06535 [Ignavibacteria bacterium]